MDAVVLDTTMFEEVFWNDVSRDLFAPFSTRNPNRIPFGYTILDDVSSSSSSDYEEEESPFFSDVFAREENIPNAESNNGGRDSIENILRLKRDLKEASCEEKRVSVESYDPEVLEQL
ncbi:hypothetical protein AVEN_94118-1 [Araneus ventricosus]|uniref:Uncharacterized protein n=1 Tax=Araneus ventricosus TaxID=182803 RepID=A0A4Y2G960_ARAVE|nr:hypothetical protein AVEN_237136-1 [Araneus ventricosus]GBM48370.1 hypothetical protein AVEN_19161-1 [Araneus ventricosus]GBM48428.1 hypothetical protein AVEN_247838-1 [Araneus ventricosus]GBM48474.1 hypothetical protein AVEN_94118-1 [Araneus ventricosus]